MTLNDSRILVIGGAGFVGSHLVDQLTRESVLKIVVLDNYVRGVRANLYKSMQDDCVRIILS